MLTPQEIQNKKFEKAVFGGYDMSQIDDFLDVVLADYSDLYKENAALKAKMRVLVEKIDEYRAVDEQMRKALYSAQVSAEKTLEEARAEADRIIEMPVLRLTAVAVISKCVSWKNSSVWFVCRVRPRLTLRRSSSC